MGKNSALNKHIKEALLFKHRTIAAIILVVICCLLLLGRLFYLQLVQHQFYSTLSRQNLLNIILLKPSRGLIYDRNGVLLAKNIPSYSLALIPEKIKNIGKTIAQLGKIIDITPDDIHQFQHYRNQYRQFDPIPLKMKLNEEQIARFYINQQFFPGVVIEARSMRSYPLGDKTSEVVGYVGRINQTELSHVDRYNYDASDDIGKNGVEKYYETDLHGTVGADEAEINATGHVVRSLNTTPPIAGKNLYLTIDSRLQVEAHNALGEENGSLVIIKPDSGEILALVSHPSFDPNLFASGISQKDYQALLNSPNHPLFNRAINGQFNAASTIKPFIAVGSLDRGLIQPSYRLFDSGWFRLPNTLHVYHDWKKGGHGWVDLDRAIEVSCDTYFFNVAAQLGIRQLDNILQQFGFGQKTHIDLPGEDAGLLPTPQWKRRAHGSPWYTGDTIVMGIGQGYLLTTPLQLAYATATLANRGIRLKPHLLLKTIAEDGTTTVQQPEAVAPVRMQYAESWQTIINAMQLVVDGPQGTAHLFGRHPNYTVAAKTGTAQVFGHVQEEDESQVKRPKQLRNHHLFIAFAPVDHPQIAIAIIIEHSAAADKIAGEIFNYYFEHPV